MDDMKVSQCTFKSELLLKWPVKFKTDTLNFYHGKNAILILPSMSCSDNHIYFHFGTPVSNFRSVSRCPVCVFIVLRNPSFRMSRQCTETNIATAQNLYLLI
jgi:hypothetical protein